MKKLLLISLAALLLLGAVFMTSCGKNEGDNGTQPSQTQQKADFRDSANDFSYENDRDTIIDFNSKKTKTEGFKNTTSTEFNSLEEIYAHAEKELTLKEYDVKFAAYDRNEKVWKVTYRKDRPTGGIESIMFIYFSDSGITMVTVLDE